MKKVLTAAILMGLMMSACCYRQHHGEAFADASAKVIQGTQTQAVLRG